MGGCAVYAANRLIRVSEARRRVPLLWTTSFRFLVAALIPWRTRTWRILAATVAREVVWREIVVPKGSFSFSDRGARLWESLMAQDPSLEAATNPLRELAISACRTADRVDELERLAIEVDPIIEGRSGPTMHPVHAEVRQQEGALARLITALRIPDVSTGKRPQHRPLRGTQKPSNMGGARVTAIEAARQRANGA